MKAKELVVDSIYAYRDGAYSVRDAAPAIVVDTGAWVLEYYVPTRRLRRPTADENAYRYGELPGDAAPTAVRGVLVLVGTHDLYRRNVLPWLAKQTREALGKTGGYVPVLGEEVQTLTINPKWLHMPYGDHLVEVAKAAA